VVPELVRTRRVGQEKEEEEEEEGTAHATTWR
jgi:hypothetical protein